MWRRATKNGVGNMHFKKVGHLSKHAATQTRGRRGAIRQKRKKYQLHRAVMGIKLEAQKGEGKKEIGSQLHV